MNGKAKIPYVGVAVGLDFPGAGVQIFPNGAGLLMELRPQLDGISTSGRWKDYLDGFGRAERRRKSKRMIALENKAAR